MLRHGTRLFLLAIALLLASLSYTQQTTSQPPAPGEVLTNGDVVKMVEAKLGNDIIVSKIRTSTCNFDTNTDAILQLKAAGVSDEVIKAMVAKTAPKEAPAKEAPPPDPDNPRSPHESGIYWLVNHGPEKRMVRLEPSSYSGTKTGGMFGSAPSQNKVEGGASGRACRFAHPRAHSRVLVLLRREIKGAEPVARRGF